MGGGLSRKEFVHTYDDIISVENLIGAWGGFVKGKKGKRDVQEFQFQLMDNILNLHRDLECRTYQHGGYKHFKISDPKPRDIHKATVRDRLLHHAIYRILYPFFDRTFIADSYSCRLRKGTHKAMRRFQSLAYTVSKNHTKTAWILQCDIKKFFASIDQRILLEILTHRIPNKDILRLLANVIHSFETEYGKGLPLGNLTSQLLVNIYMNEFDQHMKHNIKAKYYLRYADDFVVFSRNRAYLETILPVMQEFLEQKRKLVMHPDKIFIRTLASGIDFLGWVHFPDHRVLRTSTKKRMFQKIKDGHRNPETIHSYLGLLQHGNAQKVSGAVKNLF